MKPESPEEFARVLAERTANVHLDAHLATQVIARVRGHEGVERPAFLVLAVAASLVVWLSFGDETRASEATSDYDEGVVLAFDDDEGAL